MLGERLDEYTKRLKPKTPKRRGSKKPKVADGVSGTSSRAKALPGGREPKGLLSDGNEDGDGHKNENGNEDENQHQNEYKNNSRHYRDNVGSSESLKTVDVVDDGSLLPSIKVKDTDKEKPSDGEIMAEYSKAMSTCTLEKPLQSTEPHRKAAIQFYKKHGREVAIAAWVLFLWNSDNSVPGNEDEPRMWRLKDFIDSGEAELWAERVLPYIERGVLSYPALDVLMKVTDNHFAADFDYMVMMEANLSDYGKERLKLTPGLLESGLKVLYEFPNDFVGHTELGHELTRFRKSTWPKDLPGFCQYLTRGEPTLPGVTGPLAEAVAESVAEEEVAQQPFDLLSMMGHWERVPADADHTDSPKNAG